MFRITFRHFLKLCWNYCFTALGALVHTGLSIWLAAVRSKPVCRIKTAQKVLQSWTCVHDWPKTVEFIFVSKSKSIEVNFGYVDGEVRKNPAFNRTVMVKVYIIYAKKDFAKFQHFAMIYTRREPFSPEMSRRSRISLSLWILLKMSPAKMSFSFLFLWRLVVVSKKKFWILRKASYDT